MLIPPLFQLNKKIVKLLQEIEHFKTKFDLVPQDKTLEKKQRAKSILKSALFSARIEGNQQTLNSVSPKNIKNSKEKSKRELANLYQALELVLKKSWKKNLTIKNLKKLHFLTLKDLSTQAGNLRSQSSAIFNQAGVALYICPPPQEVKPLLEKWLGFVNKKNETLIPIKAALSHFSFEKIHPFLDGNGRVGRLLIHLLFKKWNYDLKGMIPFEEYLESHRQEYYHFLNTKKKDITSFVEFFLTGLKSSFKKAVKIKKRRFLAVSGRLLRYDLKKLKDAGLIKKRGVTKGVFYEQF